MPHALINDALKIKHKKKYSMLLGNCLLQKFNNLSETSSAQREKFSYFRVYINGLSIKWINFSHLYLERKKNFRTIFRLVNNKAN